MMNMKRQPRMEVFEVMTHTDYLPAECTHAMVNTSTTPLDLIILLYDTFCRPWFGCTACIFIVEPYMAGGEGFFLPTITLWLVFTRTASGLTELPAKQD